MAARDVGSERILLHGSREDPADFRARQEQARALRWGRARSIAADLMAQARQDAPGEEAALLRVLTLLAERVEAEHLLLTALPAAASEAWLVRVRWEPAGASSPGGCHGTRETLRVETRDILRIRPTIPGAQVSFHALLYADGAAQPSGCLSVFGSRRLALTADRVALIDTIAVSLASVLFDGRPAVPSPG